MDDSAQREALHATEYDNAPKSAFVVSGPLFPAEHCKIRAVTQREFRSQEEAHRWALSNYWRVYRDESNELLGYWAFRVGTKATHQDVAA